jgi:hypothetical protein
MVSLKLAGYRARHAYGVLPVDAYDYVAIHLLLCEEGKDGLQPLMGSKTVTLDRCLLHQLPFPMISLLDEAGASAAAHRSAVQSIIDRSVANRTPLCYSGSWTVAPNLHLRPKLLDEVRSLFEATYMFCQLSCGVREMFCGGAPKMRTDRTVGEWGANRLAKDGVTLPPVSIPHLQNIEMYVMHLTEFAEPLRQRSERWRSLWENRLVIDAGQQPAAAVVPLRKAA